MDLKQEVSEDLNCKSILQANYNEDSSHMDLSDSSMEPSDQSEKVEIKKSASQEKKPAI